MRMVEERCRQWSARGQPVQLHDAAATAKLTGCRGYYGSWSHALGGTVHPLKLVRGLAQAATGRGAALFEHSPVQKLRRDGTRWLVETGNGVLTADKVLVCTNALSQGILPQVARTVIPVNIYQAATTAIPARERESLLRQGQCLSDTRLDLFTYRFDAEWRLISGSFVVLEPGARARLSRRMAERLQWMLGLQQTPAIEFIWRGTAAVSPGTLPALYEPAPGVLAGTGCNGRGIALCTELGRVMAELAMGAPSKSSAVPIRPLRSHPWRSLSRWGARYYALYGRIQDKLTQLRP
jgi:glycine/D-amino acid oxidase-like deaminating enzyme